MLVALRCVVVVHLKVVRISEHPAQVSVTCFCTWGKLACVAMNGILANCVLPELEIKAGTERALCHQFTHLQQNLSAWAYAMCHD